MASSEHAENITSLSYLMPSEVTYELGKMAAKIALQNYEWRFITLVLFNSTLSFGAQVFMQYYENAVVIGKGMFYSKIMAEAKQYVLFGENVPSIVRRLKWMQDQELDNTGKYIVVCQSLDTHECNEAEAIPTLWGYKITNVIFLKTVQNQVTGFTYFPLSNESCFYDVPVRLNNLTTCLDGIDFKDQCNLYPTKFTNFNVCPLIVSTFPQLPYMYISNGKLSGSDGDLLLLLADKLNGKLRVMTPRRGFGWGMLENNGTWSGSLGDVYYEHANFSMTSADLTLSRFITFQLSNAYNTMSLVLIAEPTSKIPSSLKLTYPFQNDAQIAIIISFAIVVICSLIIRTRFWSRVRRKIKLEKPRSGIVIYSWMICMGLPLARLPTRSTLLYIVLLWIWYCLLIRTLYQVSLISAMKANYYYQGFKTIDDVIDAQYSFGGGAALRDHYIDYPSAHQLWKNVDTKDIIPSLRNVSKGMKFVIVMNMETAKNIVSREKLVVNILPQKVVTSPTVLFFKKYSPLAEALNKVLVRLVEAGFTEKSYRDYTSIIISHETGDSTEPIRIEHYAGCYVILSIGWIVSFIVFIGEIVFGKLLMPD